MLFCNIVMIRYVTLKRYAVCSNIAANLKDEIMAANVKFMYCFDTSDFDGLAALYTEDCKLMPTGSPVLVGRDGECSSK